MSTLQVGITGGIGSGKSIVCKIFQCLGVPVYDADSHAKHLMTSDQILITQIKNEFGSEAYDADGGLNRSHVSTHTFGHPERLEKLNELVHPRVALDYKTWAEAHTAYPYVVKEAALLFEAGSAMLLDKIIVVSAPVALRVRRVLERDTQRSEAEIKKIINSQMPEDEKIRRADFIVVNDESRLLIPQVLNLHQLFSSLQS